MVDPAIKYNKDNSALDLMGLGGEDQPDDFDEYDENESLKIKDTTMSDNLQNTLFMNLAGGARPGGADTGEE